MAGWMGAKIYKAPQVIGLSRDQAVAARDEEESDGTCSVEMNHYYRNLLEKVFEGKIPKEFKEAKAKAAAIKKSKKTDKAAVDAWGDVPPNAFTAIEFGATAYDFGGFVPADKKDRLVVPVSGRSLDVRVKLHTGKGVKSGGFLYAWLTRSDMESLDMQTIQYTQGQDNVTPPLLYRGPLAKGDFLRLIILHALPSLPEGYLKFGTWMDIAEVGTLEETPPPDPGPGPTPNPVQGGEVGDAGDEEAE
jgi:hypothetical protein